MIHTSARLVLAALILAVSGLGPLSYTAAETGAPSLISPRPLEWSGPWLKRTIAERPGHEVKVWVFFTDKGILDQPAFEQALAGTERSWNHDTRSRRSAAMSSAGFTDLPVYSPYVRTLEKAGFKVLRQSRWLNAVSVRVPAARVPAMAGFEFVRWIQPVLVTPREKRLAQPAEPRVVQPASAPDSSTEAAFYGLGFKQLDQIGVLDLHRQGYTGAGVKVMIIDTGFKKSHPAFQICTDLAGEYDFVNNDGNTENEGSDHSQQHRHGTGVWSTLGGYDPGELIGPAWAATFYVAKTEDITQEVQSEEDNYVAALEWADTLGVDVTSASLSYLCFDDSVCYAPEDLDGNTAVITKALDIAVGKGICCLNAAGNNGAAGAGSIWTPQDADSVISVGAVDSVGAVAGFSSFGPTFDGRIKPEILARGVKTRWAEAGSDGYNAVNGTSLATPLAAGLAALIKEAHPGWSGYDIREALMQTASNAGSPSNGPGWGIADGPAAAVYLGAVPSPPRMTLPFALCDPADSAVVATTAPTLVWSTSATAIPGDTVDYTLFYSVNGGVADSLPAVTDTSLIFLTAPAPGDTIQWWVHAVGDSGYVRKSMDTRVFIVDATVGVPGAVTPAAILLGPARPNPARGGIEFSYRLPEGEPGAIQIFNASGRLVRAYAVQGTGVDQSLRWDRRNKYGVAVVAGAYFYRLSVSNGKMLSRKVILLP